MQIATGHQPFFSIVMPFYNARATLERACHSCLAQSFADFELILINDGSTDDSLSRIGLFVSDARVSVSSFPENAGVSSARNYGIAKAQGQYLAFMDADDEWHPAKLEIMAAVIRQYPGEALYFHDLSSSHDADFTRAVSHDAMAVEAVGFKRFLIKNRAHTPCVVVPNTPAVHFNESLRYSEDYDLWLALAFPRGALRVRHALTRLGRPVGSKGGLSARRWQMRLGEMKCYMRLYRLSPWLAFLSPLLVVWSLAKHSRAMLLSVKGRSIAR